MRSETQVIRRLVAGLRDLLPGAVIFKHNDRITAGIPDLSVTWGGLTFWIEAKLCRTDEEWAAFVHHFDARQLAMGVLLQRQTGDVRYWVAYRSGRVALAKPTEVLRSLDRKVWDVPSKEWDEALNDLVAIFRDEETR